MRRGALVTLRGAAAILAVLTAGVLARADAPPGQYQSFDQGDAVITDLHTGLIWQRHDAGVQTFGQAVATCGSLSLAGYGSLWRLPSYKELSTLVDESPHLEYPTGAPVSIAIDGHAFPGTTPGPYWSSSADPNAAGNVFVVKFDTGVGETVSAAGSMASVRCVHD